MILANPELEKISELLEIYTSKRRLSSDGMHTIYLSYQIEEDGATIYENLPDLYDPEDYSAEPLAQISFNGSNGLWKVLLLKPDPDWHAYEPDNDPEVFTFPEAIHIVHQKTKDWYL
jgi:hypothetical protein